MHQQILVHGVCRVKGLLQASSQLSRVGLTKRPLLCLSAWAIDHHRCQDTCPSRTIVETLELWPSATCWPGGTPGPPSKVDEVVSQRMISRAVSQADGISRVSNLSSGQVPWFRQGFSWRRCQDANELVAAPPPERSSISPLTSHHPPPILDPRPASTADVTAYARLACIIVAPSPACNCPLVAMCASSTRSCCAFRSDES